MKKIKVLLVGETWIVVESHMKGFDVVPLGDYEDFSLWFREALQNGNDGNRSPSGPFGSECFSLGGRRIRRTPDGFE